MHHQLVNCEYIVVDFFYIHSVINTCISSYFNCFWAAYIMFIYVLLASLLFRKIRLHYLLESGVKIGDNTAHLCTD